MNRKAKGSGFKMRSTNKTTFKMMCSTSPLYKPKGMTGLTKEERKAKRVFFPPQGPFGRFLKPSD